MSVRKFILIFDAAKIDKAELEKIYRDVRRADIRGTPVYDVFIYESAADTYVGGVDILLDQLATYALVCWMP